MLFLSPQLPIERIRDCRECKACVDHCPAKAILFPDLMHFEVSREACWKHIETTEDGECWECSKYCHNGVIKMALFKAWMDDDGDLVEIQQKSL